MSSEICALFSHFLLNHAALRAMSIEMIAQYLSMFAQFRLNIFAREHREIRKYLLCSDVAQYFSRAIQPNHVHFLPFDDFWQHNKIKEQLTLIYNSSITFRASSWCILLIISEQPEKTIARATNRALSGIFATHLDYRIIAIIANELNEEAKRKVFDVADEKLSLARRMFRDGVPSEREKLLQFLLRNYEYVALELALNREVQEYLCRTNQASTFLRFIEWGMAPVFEIPIELLSLKNIRENFDELIRRGYVFNTSTESDRRILKSCEILKVALNYTREKHSKMVARAHYSRFLYSALCQIATCEDLFNICNMLLAFGANPFVNEQRLEAPICLLRFYWKSEHQMEDSKKELSRIFSLILWRMIGPLASAQHP